MRRLSSWLKAYLWVSLFWVASAVMAFAFPIYAAVASLPSKQIVDKTIIATCPATAQEKCMQAADLLQAVGSFYETIIIILIALLAAVISLVYLSIRASSKRQIEDQIESVFDTPWFQHRLQGQVDTAMQKSVAELATKVDALEAAMARANARDDSENLAPGATIIDDGGSSGVR